MVWTSGAFDRIAKETELSKRTLDACRLVLVEDMTGVDAEAATGVLRAQISRGLKTLREKDVKLQNDDLRTTMLRLTEYQGAVEVSKAMAVTEARVLAGEQLSIVDSLPGVSYVGSVLLCTPLHVVQMIGENRAVVHDAGRLERVPVVGAGVMNICYPMEFEKLASVSGVTPTQQGLGKGR